MYVPALKAITANSRPFAFSVLPTVITTPTQVTARHDGDAFVVLGMSA